MAGLPRVSDFISQSTFEDARREPARPVLPADALGHEELAATLLDRVRLLPPGAVIALQGGWGQGKTDVLARAALRTWTEQVPGFANEAVWINPWQYGTPDLLTPLVLALGRRARELAGQGRQLDMARVRDNLLTVVRAGLSFGMKAATVSVPWIQPLALPAGAAVDTLLGETEKALKAWLDSDRPTVALDPVAGMGHAFKRVVEELLTPEEREAGGRLLICVDDLDRCMPDRQVALLQALCFLTSAGAPASFVVAVDPTLARQAVLAHYRSTQFDPDRYLDKMFHLRLSLPARNADAIQDLITGRLRAELLLPGATAPTTGLDLLARAFGEGARRIPETVGGALPVRDLRNPRVVIRIAAKLEILAQTELEKAAKGRPRLGQLGAEDLRLLLVWLGIAERWPEVRAVFQDAGDQFEAVYTEVRNRFKPDVNARAGSAAVQRLPTYDEAPELGQIFSSAFVGNPKEVCVRLRKLDDALIGAGL